MGQWTKTNKAKTKTKRQEWLLFSKPHFLVLGFVQGLCPLQQEVAYRGSDRNASPNLDLHVRVPIFPIPGRIEGIRSWAK